MKKLLISLAVLFMLFSAVFYSFSIPYSIVTKKADTIMQLCKDNEKSVAAFGDALINNPELARGTSYKLILRNDKVILQTLKGYSDYTVIAEKDVSKDYKEYWTANQWLSENAEVTISKFAIDEYIDEEYSSMMIRYCFSTRLYHCRKRLKIYYGDKSAFPETDYYSSTDEYSYDYLSDSKKLCYEVDTYWFNEEEIRLGVSS